MPDYKQRSQWEKQTETSLLAAWLILREDAAEAIYAGRMLPREAIESRIASSLAYPTVDLWGGVYDTLYQQVTGTSPENPDQVRPSISHVAAIALMLSRSIDEDLRFAIQTPFEIGADGLAIDRQLAARQRAFAIFSDARLESISITETTRAITEVEKSAASDLAQRGFLVTAEWVTERDSRVCPICLPLHGHSINEIGFPFLSGPPAHPRCRCYLTWINDGEN
jgi:hypothetical protein